MIKVYFDNCCYGRPFDDLSQQKISDESNATSFVSDANTDKLKSSTNQIMNRGIKKKDATHLSCAMFANCNYFITTDRQVLNYATEKITIVNPIEFAKMWREVK